MNPTATRTRPGAFSAASRAIGSKVELRNTVTGEVSYQPAKFSGLRTAGDVDHLLLAGRRRLRRSAGARPAKVLDDVLDGFITVITPATTMASCSRVDDGYGWAMDDGGTRDLRAGMRGGNAGGVPEDAVDKRQGTCRKGLRAE
jgi:hypothetical protein